jgi:16S rRNA (guanine966-N2)-methyltransferase
MTGKKRGTVRIVAGRWRGTRLSVADLPGLRPSGDRTRETLFNWLQPHLRGSRCADLFAGSGALGLEAASRGAASVVLLETAAEAVRILAANLERLDAATVRLLQSDAISWLENCRPGSLDILFIDPPFGSGLAERALAVIEARDIVKQGGFVYLESGRGDAPVTPGAAWESVREKTLGQVRMQLLKKI